MLQIILFVIVTLAAFGFAGKNFMKVRRNILLGREIPAGNPLAAGATGNKKERWRNMLLVAFGQKKMFARWVPGVFHLFIYVAFLLTQVELIEILVDGFTGSHRAIGARLGWLYTFAISFIEILSVLAFIATIIFLARRNLIRIPRFHKPEMKGWPSMDANLILFGEILLLTGIFSMNGADTVLQGMGAAHYPDLPDFVVSKFLGPALFGGMSETSLIGIERFGWWLHILVVYAFLNYLPFSKHLHLMLAFPNTWYASLDPKGEMNNMPEIQHEVAKMMNPETVEEEPLAEGETEFIFGGNDVFSLSWKNLLDAYACTECGRCTSVCPANQTGKKLSPRKIMMDVRDRAEEVGRNLDSGDTKFIAEDKRGEGVALTAENYDDGKSLFDFIAREEIHACTTCNACVEACPVLISPLDIIVQLRRYEILTEGGGPTDWLPLFNSLENSGVAWAVSTERDAWTQEFKED